MMRLYRLQCIFCILLLIQLVQGCSTNLTASESTHHENFKAPLLLVIDDPRGERKRFGASGPGYSVNIHYAEDPLIKRATQQLVNEYQLQAAQQWPLQSLGVHCIVIESPSPEVLERLKKDKRVKWVQPFNEFSTLSSPQPKEDELTIISPLIKLPNMSDGINIIVIDTGIDTAHPALHHSDVHYRNFVLNNGSGNNEAHGTAITGLLVANNQHEETPVKGLTQQANLHHYRGCWQKNNGQGTCTTLTLALALDAAIEAKPNVLNLSLSGPKDTVLEALIDKLIAQGTIVVSAYDEKRAPTERFPIPQSGVIYAYGIHNEKPQNIPTNTFFASSTAMSLAAQGTYDIFQGHSIATPQLTAITASLLSLDPTISKNTIANRLKQWLTYKKAY